MKLNLKENWKYIAFGLWLVVVVFIGQRGCRRDSPEVIEQKIAASATLRYLDQICTEFPKPARFELEKKRFGGNARTSSISYHYIAHMPFKEVKTFYQNPQLREDYNFRAEDYKEPLINEIWFKRDDVSINIANRPPSEMVVIGCSKTS